MAEIKFPALSADQVEVRVKKITEKGCLALLYKTARVDMDMLDKCIGPMRWQCEYAEIKGTLYCRIGIYDDTLGWVWKQDAGIESRADEEGNQKKGEASDAFKRAATKWGIGRELYTAPFIWLRVPTKKDGARHSLVSPFAKFAVSDMNVEDGKITRLKVSMDGVDVFSTSGSTQQFKRAEQAPVKPQGHSAKTQAVESVITAQQIAELAKLIADRNDPTKPDPKKKELLHTAMRLYGYTKVKEIEQKNYNAIVDALTALPEDV